MRVLPICRWDGGVRARLWPSSCNRVGRAHTCSGDCVCATTGACLYTATAADRGDERRRQRRRRRRCDGDDWSGGGGDARRRNDKIKIRFVSHPIGHWPWLRFLWRPPPRYRSSGGVVVGSLRSSRSRRGWFGDG